MHAPARPTLACMSMCANSLDLRTSRQYTTKMTNTKASQNVLVHCAGWPTCAPPPRAAHNVPSRSAPTRTCGHERCHMTRRRWRGQGRPGTLPTQPPRTPLPPYHGQASCRDRMGASYRRRHCLACAGKASAGAPKGASPPTSGPRRPCPWSPPAAASAPGEMEGVARRREKVSPPRRGE